MVIPSNESKGDEISIIVFLLLSVKEDPITEQTFKLNFHSKFVASLHFFQFNKRLAMESRCL